MRALVLGGYGLIGLEIVRRLHAAGHDVVGLGRSVASGRRRFPKARWIAADIAKRVRSDDWCDICRGIDVFG